MDILICLGSYVIFSAITVALFYEKCDKGTSVELGSNKSAFASHIGHKNFSLLLIVFIALLFVFQNVIVTKINPSTTSDRGNYSLNFYGYRPSPSVGLNFIISIVQMFSSNVEVLFYVTTFLIMVITLFSFRINMQSTAFAVLFLLATQYVFFSFEGLKQSYTNAFASLCIALQLKNDHKINNVLPCAILIVLAMIFHHTGYLLIPLYVILSIKKTKQNTVLLFIIMALSILFLDQLLPSLLSVIPGFASILSEKISDYVGDSANEDLQTESMLTVLKGTPFFIITLVGWFKRHQLRNIIDGYDNYLFLSGITSFIYIATIYNGWIYRLSYFFYIPVGIFYGQLIRYFQNPYELAAFKYVPLAITGLLTIRFVVLMYVNYGGF